MHVFGAIGTVDVEGVADAFPDGDVAVIDAGMVCGRRHAEAAGTHARRAFARGTNRSRTLAVETIVYASGSGRINRALDRMRPRSGKVVVVSHAATPEEVISALGLERDDTVMGASLEKAVRLGIPLETAELVGVERVEELAVEMVAMVDLS